MASVISASTTSATALNLSGDTTGILQLATGATPTTAVTIDASQNVGIGTTSPVSKFDVLGNVNNSASSFGANDAATIDIRNASGTALSIKSKINFGLTDGLAYGYSTIAGVYTNYNGTGDIGTALAFGTQTNAAGGVVERMRIDSSGNVLVGYTTSNGSYKLQVNSQIFATSSTVATSDANYKTNVIPLTGALALVNNLNPVSFSWKPHLVHDFDVNTPTLGFLAQEVQAVLANESYVNSVVKKSTCTITSEIKDEKGNITTPAVTEDFLGIAEGNMISILTKAIQELKAIIDTQQTQITALEAK